MIKFGISRVEDYQPPAGGAFSRLRRMLTGNRVSYRLLRASVPPGPDDVARFETIMHTMLLGGNIYRTTQRRRFQELDQVLIRKMLEMYAPSQALEVHDWAASDCLTPMEWAAPLFRAFPAARLVASDRTMYLIDLRIPGGAAYILDSTGAPLQYVKPPFVLRLNPPEPTVLLVNCMLARRALTQFERLRKQIPLPSWIESGNDTHITPAFELHKISAVHPEAEALSAADPRFRIQRHSVFDALPQPVDVIRTMNILNRAYFPPDRLQEGARAVWNSLKEGGLWIVGRTIAERTDSTEASHNGSLFERTKEGFRLLDHFGTSSEIADLVLEAKY